MTAIRRFAGQHRGLLRAAVSVTVSAVLLYLVLRAVPPGELLDALAEVPPVLPLLAAIAAFAFIVARAWRYRLLLGIPRSQTGTLLAVTLSSWGASLILPGPSGDAVFAWLARTRLGKPLAGCVGAAPLRRVVGGVSPGAVAPLTPALPRGVLPTGVLAAG